MKEIERKFYLVDAKDRILGRLSTGIACVLRGKHRPAFSPDKDEGDFVVVLNAAAVRLTGKKEEAKVYYHHSGYPGGLKKISYLQMRKKKPEEIIRHAVHGMLPKNKLRKKMMSRLKIYAEERHPHQAQKLEPLKI